MAKYIFAVSWAIFVSAAFGLDFWIVAFFSTGMIEFSEWITRKLAGQVIGKDNVDRYLAN